ncbi:MAG: thioredoxin family protein [Candidatus Magasanikbacteria bacterium]|nr:thioredoxin family protein [Candidatus Magasanikbacteria bacterium]
MIKRILMSFFALVLLFGIVAPAVAVDFQSHDPEKDKVEFVLFHSKTCPHCKEEIEFIEEDLMEEYGEHVDFKMYEVGEVRGQDLFRQYASFYHAETGSVPITFIDGEVVYGFGNKNTTGKQIIRIIEEKIALTCPDFTQIYKDADSSEEQSIIHIPMIGEINAHSFSLPLLTVVLGVLDGFNPCAMWVLLFLISLLLGIEDRKRMWLLGGIFIFSSGLVYFFFMAAWLHFLMFVGMLFAVRLIIGALSIGIGAHSMRDYWKQRKADGLVCKVSKKDNTKKTFSKIKEIVYKKSLWWSILGIVLLGFSVNLVELACSAGFPAIFTQVLSLNDLPNWQRYLYMFGYILFYMIDDMIIFIIAMVTLKSKSVGTKYAKYANLIGGVLIFLLGVLLIFKPEWLMFG